MDEYTLGMDFIRERFDLPTTTSLYEAVATIVSEFKILEELLQKSQEEKLCLMKPKKSKKASKSQK
jgi:hypothetical protein